MEHRGTEAQSLYFQGVKRELEANTQDYWRLTPAEGITPSNSL